MATKTNASGVNTNTGLATLDYQELAYSADYKVSETEAAVFAKVVVSNDLTPLQPDEKVIYYFALSRMAGLNPLNRPFEILKFDDGRETLYATKRCSDELRFNHKLNVEIVEREVSMNDTILRVSARVTFPDGRTDTADGVVPLVKEEITGWETNPNSGKRYPVKSGNWIPLNPIEYSNAVMKAETKAKRRATLSAVGLGMLDESELETIPRSRAATIDVTSGEIKTKEPMSLPSTSDRNAALAALYATAREHGITEEDLKLVAKSWNYTGMSQAKSQELANLAEKIKANPDGAKTWIESMKPTDVEEEVSTLASPEIRSAVSDIRELANDFGWTPAQLKAVSENVISVDVGDASEDQLNELYLKLITSDESIRAQMLADADKAA